MRVGGEDAAGPLVEPDVDGLLAGADLADHLVGLEIDDRDEVAPRAGHVGAAALDVHGDPFGIEADRDLGDLPPR